MPFKDKEYNRIYQRECARKKYGYPRQRIKKGKEFSCKICGKIFYREPSNIKKGITKFCSFKCFGEQMKKDWKKGIKTIPTNFKNTGRTHFKKGYDVTKHWNWQGGITPQNTKIRNSIETSLWREAVFTRDNWVCQKCKIKGGKLHPHHICNFADYPELRLAINNGVTLCRKCHLKFHKKYGKKQNTKKQLKEFLNI